MADQTTLDNGRQAGSNPAGAIHRRVRSAAHDIATLAELQLQLLRVDIHEAGARMILLAALMLFGLVLALGCLPVGMLGFGYLLKETAGLSLWASFLTVAGSGLIIVVVLLGLAWFRLRNSIAVLRHSQMELERNVRWIKQVFSASSHSLDEW
jgi:hypothetical protein